MPHARVVHDVVPEASRADRRDRRIETRYREGRDAGPIVSDVSIQMSAAGPPQGANSAPSGGSAAATAASVGVHSHFSGLRGALAEQKSLAKYTSWRTGGCGDTVYLPADRDDLAGFLRQLPPGEPLTPLGLGSNTLVRDGGVRGTVVVLHDPGAALEIGRASCRERVG